MRRLSTILMLGLLCVYAPPAFAIFGLGDVVYDPTNWVENATTALNAVKTAANTSQQVINEYNIIVRQVEQIANQVKNLQRIPQGLNFMDDIRLFGSKVTGLLGQANTLSFEIDQATKQFDALYRQAATVTTTGDILALRQQMLSARMQASGMAVQMQSVRTNLTDIYTRLCTLLNGSWGASGNLDSQQLAAQQQALQTHTLQWMQAMQATNARLLAQQQAEEIVMEQLRLKRLQELSVPLAPYVGGNGRLVTYRW